MECYPIRLKPAYQHYIWGGRHLAERYGRDIGEENCAESWEISDRPEGMGVVENGVYRGKSLSELLQAFPKELVGCQVDKFPVLIKLIDAALPLSVQVHPNEEAAVRLRGEPKSEMWYVLAAEVGAKLYLGLQDGVNHVSFEEGLRLGKVQHLLKTHAVKPGDFFYIPAGTVHAIGQGCLIYEVQQNSNTTYRVWDWNRLDSNGKPRQLHTQQALQSIHWRAHAIGSLPKVLQKKENGHYDCLLETPYFVIEKLTFTKEWELEGTLQSYTTVFCSKGSVQVCVEAACEELKCGDSCLIPAAAGKFTFFSSQGCSLILTRRGQSRSL